MAVIALQGSSVLLAVFHQPGLVVPIHAPVPTVKLKDRLHIAFPKPAHSQFGSIQNLSILNDEFLILLRA